MLIHRLNEDSIEFTDVEPIEADLLRQIPILCDVHGDSRAESRLFSTPADPSQTQFLTDWEEYVRPELQHIADEVARRLATALAGLPGEQQRMS